MGSNAFQNIKKNVDKPVIILVARNCSSFSGFEIEPKSTEQPRLRKQKQYARGSRDKVDKSMGPVQVRARGGGVKITPLFTMGGTETPGPQSQRFMTGWL